MTPSQSNITRSTLCNASANLLLSSRQRNLSWCGFDGKREAPRTTVISIVSSRPAPRHPHRHPFHRAVRIPLRRAPPCSPDSKTCSEASPRDGAAKVGHSVCQTMKHTVKRTVRFSGATSVPLGARGQDPDAEALELAVSDIVSWLAGSKPVDTSLVETNRCHWISSCALLQPGRKRGPIPRLPAGQEEIETLYQDISAEGALRRVAEGQGPQGSGAGFRPGACP